MTGLPCSGELPEEKSKARDRFCFELQIFFIYFYFIVRFVCLSVFLFSFRHFCLAFGFWRFVSVFSSWTFQGTYNRMALFGLWVCPSVCRSGCDVFVRSLKILFSKNYRLWVFFRTFHKFFGSEIRPFKRLTLCFFFENLSIPFKNKFGRQMKPQERYVGLG